MTAKDRIIATLVGTIVLFLLGWLFYGFLLMNFYAENAGSVSDMMRAEEDIIWWALILGNVFQAYLLVYVFNKWAKITSFSTGLKAGATIGLIIGLAINLSMFGTTNSMNLTSALVDPFVSMVMMGVTGGVIGVLIGRK
ncbi:MAG: DUF1761 domain-containing protein [Cyclobacteriaceae bacterium]